MSALGNRLIMIGYYDMEFDWLVQRGTWLVGMYSRLLWGNMQLKSYQYTDLPLIEEYMKIIN